MRFRKRDELNPRHQRELFNQAEAVAGQLVIANTEMKDALAALRAERAAHDKEHHEHR